DGGTSTSDSFTYKANDGLSDSNVATVMIAVPATVQPVVAQNDVYSVERNGTVSGNVLSNDSDPQHNPLSAAVATNPAHGTLALNADGVFSYHNNGDTANSDTFTYRASNGVGSPVTATVTISI